MAWREAIYVQFPDEETARVMATSLGVDFPDDGTIPSGNQNYAMHAPMTPPEGEPGYWAMLRLNDEFVGYADLVAAIEASGTRRYLATPPVVWA